MARSAAGAVTARQMAAVMGRSLGMREGTATYQTLHERVRAGLPYAALATLVARYALTGNEVVAVLRIPQRPLPRRKLAPRPPRAPPAPPAARRGRRGRVPAASPGGRGRPGGPGPAAGGRPGARERAA